MTKTILRWTLATVLGTLAVLAMLGAVAVMIGGPLWLLYQLLGSWCWTLLTWGSLAALGVAAVWMILSWGHDLARRIVRTAPFKSTIHDPDHVLEREDPWN